jgi:hypothetical protein
VDFGVVNDTISKEVEVEGRKALVVEIVLGGEEGY